MSDNHPKRLMLMFTIGPVQSFIEAARKTEDLWMGSYILSYLVAQAMDKVLDKVRGSDVELIYPAIGSQSPFDFWKDQDFTTPSFPNLFLAVGNGIEVSQLVDRAKAAEDSVKAEFERMAECVIDEAFKKWRGTYVEEVFERQASDFFDVYWVITEEETDQNYGAWYAHTAGSLASIKNCRAFKQTSELGRKCSLDGTREILHLKKDESVRNAMSWWKNFAECKPKYCRREEALCAISLTKRMGRRFLETQSKFKDEFSHDTFLSFPSTSEVATADFKEQIQWNLQAGRVYRNFFTEVKKLRASNDREADIPIIKPLPKIENLQKNIDGEWLYEETWSESYLKRYYNIDAKKEKAQIQKCKQLRQKLVRLLGEPGRYYAAIALDADRMGEKNRECEKKEEHAEHSKLLIQYTKDARQIIEQDYLGKLTYAGGDDLLALANLKELLPMLKALREKFPDFTTASAGVCIAHSKVPLGIVLQQARGMEKAAKQPDAPAGTEVRLIGQQARGMEKAAKQQGGRDALGIRLLKHSGNISEVITKWKQEDLDVLAISEELIELLLDEEVSKRFLYDLRETFAKLEDKDGSIDVELEKLVEFEFVRIMERARSDKEPRVEEIKHTIHSLTQLIYDIQPFAHFLGYLEIVNFVARQKK